LLWSPYEEEAFPPYASRTARLPATYQAPSLSWASIELRISDSISRETFVKKSSAQVVDVHLDYNSNSGEYGQVTGSYIKVRRPLRSAITRGAMVKLLFQPNLWNIPSPSKIDKNDFDYSISDIGWLNHGVEDLLLQITDAYGLILEIFHSKD